MASDLGITFMSNDNKAWYMLLNITYNPLMTEVEGSSDDKHTNGTALWPRVSVQIVYNHVITAPSMKFNPLSIGCSVRRANIVERVLL